MPTGLLHNFRIDPVDLPSEDVIFGTTAAMRDLHTKIDRIIHNDLPVLIRGESGTGKEVIAKYLHVRSNPADAPFVKLNCAAIPAGLLDSELFSSEEDDYSNGSENRYGVVEFADGGTLFLDEIGDMEWSLQTKLLHLMHEGRHVGGAGGQGDRRGRVRVICATNSNLEAAIETRSFRQDLFYRIDVIGLHLLPLRERKEDIPQLCEYFMQKLARKFGMSAPQLTPAVVDSLKKRNWPGNLRELENWAARAIALGGEEALDAEFSRQIHLADGTGSAQAGIGRLKDASRQAASEAARTAILKVLQANHWDRRTTAEDLNMSYRSLLYKLRDVGVTQRRRNKKEPPPIQ
jgi:two-component system response regulator AtoC